MMEVFSSDTMAAALPEVEVRRGVAEQPTGHVI